MDSADCLTIFQDGRLAYLMLGHLRAIVELIEGWPADGPNLLMRADIEAALIGLMHRDGESTRLDGKGPLSCRLPRFTWNDIQVELLRSEGAPAGAS